LNKVLLGDCLKLIKDIPDKSVDLILQDPPYNTTACKWEWDIMECIDEFWSEWKRIIKDKGAIVLTASQPFTSALVMSNVKMFKYELIWEKSNPSNISLANKQPMKYHENICVFYKKQTIYNKQMTARESPRIKQAQKNDYIFHNSESEQTGLKYIEVNSFKYDCNFKNPSSIIKVNSLRPNSKEFAKHPTQKPVALFEYLIKTYTNEGDLVLDNCMGSGTTGVACKNINRNFIGIELDPEYFKIAEKRINENL
jgi:site-specific DNA-methyltransferase (adenine-specific)